jgi:hypothetical protein
MVFIFLFKVRIYFSSHNCTIIFTIIISTIPVFGYIIENKMKNNLLIFFFKFIKIIRKKSYKLKSWMRMKLKKKLIS